MALLHLERAVEDFASAVVAGDPDAPVPTCPGWDLRALIHHLGNVHRWARAAIVEGHPNTSEVDAPADPAALVGWYRECAGVLLDTLRTVDPDMPCWTFGPKPATAAFWFRRQMHETAMHHLDAEFAGGGPVPGLDPVVALDGVDEVVGMFFPRQVRLARIAPLTSSVALVPDDAALRPDGLRWADDLRWVIAGDGTGSRSAPDAATAVEVIGSAQGLLELLWHRRTPDHPDLHVAGDRAALDAVLGVAVTP